METFLKCLIQILMRKIVTRLIVEKGLLMLAKVSCLKADPVREAMWLRAMAVHRRHRQVIRVAR
jgi:hypothetical protein